MKLKTKPFLQQQASWPISGQHILAQFDDDSVTVYQAYNPSIGHFAAQHGYFGGDFKLSRMTWIKPNFLWMMYRSGWGTKSDQEVTLAVRLKREAFDYILANAVSSSFKASPYIDHQAWKTALATSEIRLQWDPDHEPNGSKAERRAIQLGLRGKVAAKYAREWTLGIEDISTFVAEQRTAAKRANWGSLITPAEREYLVTDELVRKRLGMPPLAES